MQKEHDQGPSNELQKNFLDQEFDDAESDDLDLAERADLTRTLLDEVFEDSGVHPFKNPVFKHRSLEYKYADGKDGIHHFILPDFSWSDTQGEPPERALLREWYRPRGGIQSHNQTSYSQTPERTFIKVFQGRIWSVERARHPYLRLGMSECSALIAVTKKTISLAHIGSSYQCQFEAAHAHFLKHGVRPEDLYVVASVGDLQEERAEKYRAVPRLSKSEEYLARGIVETNIIPFSYEPAAARDPYTREVIGSVHQNLVRVDVTNHHLLAYAFDETTYDVKDKRVLSPYRNLRLLSLEP